MSTYQSICAVILGLLLLGYCVRRAGDVPGLMWSLGFGVLISVLVMGVMGVWGK